VFESLYSHPGQTHLDAVVEINRDLIGFGNVIRCDYVVVQIIVAAHDLRCDGAMRDEIAARD
jgi:hypothetical protein